MSLAKDHLNVVVLGHTESGKSTTIGHLLYKLNEIDRRVVDRYDRESRDNTRPNMKYAWVLDRLKHEREAGITLDLTMVKLETPKYSCTIIDVPGHRGYVKNMIAGTCQADCAVMVVDAFPGAFELGIAQVKLSKRSKDKPAERQDQSDRHKHNDQPQGQTREHAILAYYFGVRQLVVAVNKMDKVEWQQARYVEVKERLGKVLRGVGYDVDKIPFIPVSSYQGDLLVEERSSHMPWYKGPSLLRALDNMTAPPRQVEKPLRLPISDIFKIGGIGTVPCGRVEYGVLTPEMRVHIAPIGLETVITSVEKHQETLQQAMPGDNVGFNIKGIPTSDLFRGLVVSDAANQPAAAAKSFTARIVVLNHPNSIRVGYCPVVDIHTAHVACRFTKLISRTPKGSKDVIDSPVELLPGDKATIVMVPLKPLCVEAYSEFAQLGCFAVRDLQTTVAVGQVLSVERAAQGEGDQAAAGAQSNGDVH